MQPAFHEQDRGGRGRSQTVSRTIPSRSGEHQRDAVPMLRHAPQPFHGLPAVGGLHQTKPSHGAERPSSGRAMCRLAVSHGRGAARTGVQIERTERLDYRGGVSQTSEIMAADWCEPMLIPPPSAC